MATEITFQNGTLTISAGERPIIARALAATTEMPLVADGGDTALGTPVDSGTRVEAGSTHSFCTGDGVRFLVEDADPPLDDPAA